MKIYKSPRTKKWEKHEEERKLKKIKMYTPKAINYTTSVGEKIKYIPCDVDYEIEVEKKKYSASVITKPLNDKKLSTL